MGEGVGVQTHPNKPAEIPFFNKIIYRLRRSLIGKGFTIRNSYRTIAQGRMQEFLKGGGGAAWVFERGMQAHVSTESAKPY